eukprot:tig00020807_g14067.t1
MWRFVKLAGLDPSAAAVQRAVRTLQAVLYAHEGSLRQIVLDDKGLILIAVWGLWPVAHDDDPVRAVACAVDMQESMKAIGVTTSIGITTGLVFCTFVGSPTRCEFSVFGTTVNRAGTSRLMAKSPGDIYTDSKTHDACRSKLKMSFVGHFTLKGIEGQVPLYRPERRGGAPITFNGSNKSGANPEGDPITFTARSAEALRIDAVVRAAAAAAAAGGPRPAPPAAVVGVAESPPPRVLLFEGGGGSGKSALLAHARHVAAGARMMVVVSAAQASRGASPLFLWRAVVRALFPNGAIDMGPLVEGEAEFALLWHLVRALHLDAPDRDREDKAGAWPAVPGGSLHGRRSVRGSITQEREAQSVRGGRGRRATVTWVQLEQLLPPLHQLQEQGQAGAGLGGMFGRHMQPQPLPAVPPTVHAYARRASGPDREAGALPAAAPRGSIGEASGHRKSLVMPFGARMERRGSGVPSLASDLPPVGPSGAGRSASPAHRRAPSPELPGVVARPSVRSASPAPPPNQVSARTAASNSAPSEPGTHRRSTYLERPRRVSLMLALPFVDFPDRETSGQVQQRQPEAAAEPPASARYRYRLEEGQGSASRSQAQSQSQAQAAARDDASVKWRPEQREERRHRRSSVGLFDLRVAGDEPPAPPEEADDAPFGGPGPALGEQASDYVAQGARELLARLVARRAATGRPLLLVLDDLHHADSHSWAALQELAAVLHDAAADESAPAAVAVGRGAAERVALGPLADADAEALICAAMRAARVPRAVRDFFRAQTDNSPFLIVDLARTLLEDGSIEVDAAGEAVVKRALRRLKPSDGARAALIGKLDRLTAAQATTLKLAAVIGVRFGEAEILSIHPGSTGSFFAAPEAEAQARAGAGRPAAPSVEELRAAREVQGAGGGGALLEVAGEEGGAEAAAREFEFQQPLLQEVVYTLLPVTERKVLHLRLALFHEHRAASRSRPPDEDPDAYGAPPDKTGAGAAAGEPDPEAVPVDTAFVLAHHFVLAQEPTRACRYLERCAEAAMAACANLEVVDTNITQSRDFSKLKLSVSSVPICIDLTLAAPLGAPPLSRRAQAVQLYEDLLRLSAGPAGGGSESRGPAPAARIRHKRRLAEAYFRVECARCLLAGL